MEKVPSPSTSLISFLLLIIFLIPFIFYLITLQNTLKAISAENRKMQPSQVWLMLVPIVGIVWHFIIVSRISDSVKAEYLLRAIDLQESRPGYSIGLTMCIANCIALFSDLLGVVSSIAAILFLFCWIIYWYKVASFKKQITNSSLITLDAEINFKEN